MHHRSFHLVSLVAALVAIGTATPTSQSKTPIPRLADGRPDLQGTWDFAQLTPLDRPPEFKDKDSITEEKAEEFAQRRTEPSNKDRRDAGPAADVDRASNDSCGASGTRTAN